MDKTRLELAAASVARSVKLAKEAVRLVTLGDEEGVQRTLAEARRELQQAGDLSEQLIQENAANDDR